MKKILIIAAAAVTLLGILSGCGSSRKKALLPTISGKAGEVIVVVGKGEWEGSVGI